MNTKYFSGDVELKNVVSLDNARFCAIGGVFSKANYFDSFARLVGSPKEGPDAIFPVTRKVFYKDHPSMHKCDSRCRHAKGQNCECECGGKYHGAGG